MKKKLESDHILKDAIDIANNPLVLGIIIGTMEQFLVGKSSTRYMAERELSRLAQEKLNLILKNELT